MVKPSSPREEWDPVVVQVWGDAALFTRPELKVERVTYPVMTPSAAVGVLEAIFWKPEFDWRVTAIEVLRPVRQFTQRRNETSDLPPLAEAAKGERRVDTAAHRVQRFALCLKDVAYRIHAQVELRPHATHRAEAYRDQFRRRVRRGACFHQPYLGTREFSAYFGLPDDTPAVETYTEDLGLMIHSIDHSTEPPTTHWFHAEVVRGRMNVPPSGVAVPRATPVGVGGGA
ncbi:type I-C CRISPR-associated protein Cas5 [Actinoalloteichus sp. AHMU CJ021]|uniref:pre-crRNA processing endonuclease n=1 Tax=Actinoalloteichus caeruleus DSM 43889 TaxID=1120930 RepID=A0ABT1JCG0_ACTCY|nr:type I-C CRISPR-associated protein Cas5c [Actinoalloteichus caeruleus]AUS80739.1 type I-C CRISPR-associated protein Cas5 [Actinoalloteichus sp. AHMU CJ021]MCP2330138.1 CRISPR-associated protein Cas5d [Actinoalloteichus caeruleus DSM 43889]